MENRREDVYFDEDADCDKYINDQYKEIIISCLEQPDSQENIVGYYGIQGFDSEGYLTFSWLSYDDKYTVMQTIWDKDHTSTNSFDWKFSGQDYTDIVNARSEK